MSNRRLSLLVTLPSMMMLIGKSVLAPTANQAFAATSVDYRTHVSLQCYTSGIGKGEFQLLKNGKVIGSANLTCGGYLGKSDAYPTTEG
ncbi:MAG TPA: hypothetical protein VJZ68_01820 [Nitrososphaera sp.]|nr:hypothetical protein [Nitrososphaera sp.]